MLGRQLRQPFGCSGTSQASSLRVRNASLTARPLGACSRQQLDVQASWNPFGNKGDSGNKEDAARKAIQQSFNTKKFGAGAQNTPKKPAGKPAEPPAPADKGPSNPLQNMMKGMGGGGGAAGGGGGGGGGGDGGGGFGGFGGTQPSGDGGGEQPILQEFLELMRGISVIIGNLALFLLFAGFLHRSLNWFVQTELLVVVGAPQQAMERVVGKFFEVIEWFERHVLGWTLPGDEEAEMSRSRVYEVLQNYTPPEAAYSFMQLKHKLTYEEAQLLHRAYALRYFERSGGKPDDVDWAEVERVKAKYNPEEADRQLYKAFKRQGREAEYWALWKQEAEQQLAPQAGAAQ